MINIISRIVITILGAYLRNGSNLVFYTILYYFLKNSLFIIMFKSNMNNLNKNQESKKLLYIGFSGSLLLITILSKNLRNSLRPLNYI